MSSEQIKEMELERSGEFAKGLPEQFTVLGADISAKDLAARYSKNEWARKVIGVLANKRGERAVDVPEVFWHTLRNGVIVPINFVYLGKDDHGQKWRLVICGQHRTMGLRIVNREKIAAGGQPLKMRGIPEPLPKSKDGILAAIVALDMRSAENIRVAMRPSDMATDALLHERAGRSVLDIASKLGIREEVADVEVPQYIALAQCVDEVRDAVDAGTLPIAKCIRLAQKSEDKQRAAVAPKKKGAPREVRRTLPGDFAKAWAAKVPEGQHMVVAVLKFMGGDLKALDAYPTLKAAAEDAGFDAETGRVRRGEK